MSTELKETFAKLCETARGKGMDQLKSFFRRPSDMDEFEIESFQNFLKNNKVFFEKVEELGKPSTDSEEEGQIARLFYAYQPPKAEKPILSDYTWFAFQKTPESGEWKVTGKGAYLKRLAQVGEWRVIKGESMNHFFDYSIKKSMDHINAGCAQDEYSKLLEYMEEKAPDTPMDCFVFDDEKSLPEIGLEAGTAGVDWVFSNQPCDLFQITSHLMRQLNSRVPRFFLFGFSAYYAQFVAEGRYPVVNASKDDFTQKAAEFFNEMPPDKMTKLVSNVEFDHWAQYVAFMIIMSKKGVHPHTIMLLISASFIQFLAESPDLGSSPEIRKEKILKLMKKGTTENFENLFKETTGLKLRKVDKLWRKWLKKAKG